MGHYLTDPKGNGIEVYRDKPSKGWPQDTDGNIMMDILPLDLNSLAAEMNNREGEEEKEKGI